MLSINFSILFNCFHNHLPVLLGLVLQIFHHSGDNILSPNLVRQSHSGINELAVIPAVQCHPVNPKVLEVVWHNLFSDIGRFDTVRLGALTCIG